ncbi:MAG: hypothetical protein ABSA11_07205 [Candidatus Bathyarchaeia archaeon]
MNNEVNRMDSTEETQNMIQKAFQDPITDLLLKNSNLTRIQFETLMIDLLIDVMSDEKISLKNKTLFRTRKVSRGSFSRTLGQARHRVISSIFTIVLLSYVGIYDSKPFEEYQNLSEKLREYLSLIEKSSSKRSPAILKRIEDELTLGIESLSHPTKLKVM